MYNSINNKTFVRNKTVTTVLLTLSVLILILSCPLKRFLQLNQNTPVSIESRIKQKTGLAILVRTSNSCFSASQKTVLVQENKFSSHPKPDQNVTECNTQSGFDINYFLSRSKSVIAYSENRISSLPLFLQHRSLLI
jgi:hypothetical protein